MVLSLGNSMRIMLEAWVLESDFLGEDRVLTTIG